MEYISAMRAWIGIFVSDFPRLWRRAVVVLEVDPVIWTAYSCPKGMWGLSRRCAIFRFNSGISNRVSSESVLRPTQVVMVERQ